MFLGHHPLSLPGSPTKKPTTLPKSGEQGLGAGQCPLGSSHSSKCARTANSLEARPWVTAKRAKAQPDAQRDLHPASWALAPGCRAQFLPAFSKEDPSTKAWAFLGQAQDLQWQRDDEVALISGLLKGKQVGSRCFPAPSALGALGLLLFFSCSVLRPGRSQDPGRFCLSTGPLLFIRRKATSGI